MSVDDLTELEDHVRVFLPLLGRIPVIADLSGPELEELARHFTMLDVAKGTAIVSEGEIGDSAYFLVGGEVEVFEWMTLKTSRSGFEDKERTLVRLSADQGVCIGEPALLEDTARSANVVALTPCTLLALSRSSLQEFSRRFPAAGLKVALAIGRILARRVLKMTRDVKKLTTALSIAVR